MEAWLHDGRSCCQGLVLDGDCPGAGDCPAGTYLGSRYRGSRPGSCGVRSAGAVLAAVNHAEIVAHRVGEPFGSLVLAVAVTVIEVGLIVALMTGGGPGTASLARDTVFAAVMITCNGIVGIASLIGAVRFHLTIFNAEEPALRWPR